jgi:hypothetical protein
MSVVDDSHDHPMKLAERGSAPLAGGILARGYQCGMLWGAALAAGAEAHRLYGSGPYAEAMAIRAARGEVAAFHGQNHHIDCRDIADLEMMMSGQFIRYFLTGGPIRCFRMAGKYAPVALRAIETSFSDDGFNAPAPPVSCASVVARKMGASELHTVMAAGLAGGIGLSGSGCGALGAAIWILGMAIGQAKTGMIGFDDPSLKEVVDSFAASAGPDLNCAAIAGRTFEDVGDHARYLAEGGCSHIMDLLAATK